MVSGSSSWAARPHRPWRRRRPPHAGGAEVTVISRPASVDRALAKLPPGAGGGASTRCTAIAARHDRARHRDYLDGGSHQCGGHGGGVRCRAQGRARRRAGRPLPDAARVTVGGVLARFRRVPRARPDRPGHPAHAGRRPGGQGSGGGRRAGSQRALSYRRRDRRQQPRAGLPGRGGRPHGLRRRPGATLARACPPGHRRGGRGERGDRRDRRGVHDRRLVGPAVRSR